MELHHKKHHQTYITNLNAVESTLSTLQAQPQTPSTVKEIISLQPAVKFNGGGHINHSLFWKNLTPAGSEEAKVVKGGEFERLVERDFGGVEGLKKEVNAKTAAIQGSGWGWVVSLAIWFFAVDYLFLVSSLLPFVSSLLFFVSYLFPFYFRLFSFSLLFVPPLSSHHLTPNLYLSIGSDSRRASFVLVANHVVYPSGILLCLYLYICICLDLHRPTTPLNLSSTSSNRPIQIDLSTLPTSRSPFNLFKSTSRRPYLGSRNPCTSNHHTMNIEH
jgi:hypothetical protein